MNRLQNINTLSVYETLTLRIKLEVTRQVVYLMHHGWVFIRDLYRRAYKGWSHFVRNPITKVKFDVSRRASKQLVEYWVEFVKANSRFIYYRLKPGII